MELHRKRQDVHTVNGNDASKLRNKRIIDHEHIQIIRNHDIEIFVETNFGSLPRSKQRYTCYMMHAMF